jgi:pyridoxamine 5'-phosphate oxidase
MTPATRQLREEDVDPDPLVQFRRWFAEAASQLPMAEAAALATSSTDGRPSVRMVLVKHWDQRGFTFFSNYQSRKGRELEGNPRAALLFHWLPLGRQVRVEGTVKRVDGTESDQYFASRPRGSQLGALASAQSHELASREALTQRVSQLERDLDGKTVPRPSCWGGYRLRPVSFELWQHQDDRLHDRLRYLRLRSGWQLGRLQP